MKRRGSFDPSDYNFTTIVQAVGETLRGLDRPITLEALARTISRAGAPGLLRGDAVRAAYQIEGRDDDHERGWVLLSAEASKVLKRSRAVEEDEQGLRWVKQGPDPIWITYRGRRLPIRTQEGKSEIETTAERRLRLTPNPFTEHHVKASHPLIRPGRENLPGRAFDAAHVETQELRQSLLTFGYIEQLPVLVDEYDVVLDGRTRVRLCAELRKEFPEREDLEPVRRSLELGSGPEANARRLKIALASNVGRRNLSTETKREVARYLYDEREWTYEQIAQALDVSERTIRRMAAEGRAQRQTQARPKRYVDSPEWQTVADPLIREWIQGRLAGDDVISELKARGSKGTGWSTINERKAQLEAEAERSPSKTGTVPEVEDPLETDVSEMPVLDEPSVLEELGFVIVALEEHDAPAHLIEWLRAILAKLETSVES